MCEGEEASEKEFRHIIKKLCRWMGSLIIGGNFKIKNLFFCFFLFYFSSIYPLRRFPPRDRERERREDSDRRRGYGRRRRRHGDVRWT